MWHHAFDGNTADVGTVVAQMEALRGQGLHFLAPLAAHKDLDQEFVDLDLEQFRIPRHFGARQCVLSSPHELKLPDGGSSSSWEDTLAQFARSNTISVIADAFVLAESRARPARIWPPRAGASPDELLDRLCIPYDYTWNAEESPVLFRRRDWYLERARQIPRRLERRWRQVALEQGIYPVAELARMAGLNEGQRAKLWKYVGVHTWETVMRHRDLLVLYASLRPTQRALAHSEGLTVDRLDVAQQELLKPVLAKVRPGRLDLSRSLVRIQAREVPGTPTASLTLVFRDGKRETAVLNRRATPPSDPWTTHAMPLP